MLVERWDVNRHLHDERLPIGFVGEDDKKELLRRIALRMQAGSGHQGNYLTGEELQREFEEYLRTRFRRDEAEASVIARAMISQFRERNFILSRYGGELYGFVHRAFLEFFCAEAYRWQFEKDRTIDLDYLKVNVFGAHWNNPSWREVLRLTAGTIRERWMAEVVAYLVDEVNLPWPWQFKDNPPWNLALAAQCLSEKRLTADLDQAARRVLIRTIQLLEHCVLDGDPQSTRLLEAEIIPAIATAGPMWPGREAYLDWYLSRGIRLVWSPVSELAALIAACLFPDEPRLVRSFLDAISATSDRRLRRPLEACVIGYGSADPRVAAMLLDRAASDGSDAVRTVAVRALASGNDPRIRELLLDRAAGDCHPDVRAAAVDALAALPPDPDIRAQLLRAASSADQVVRQAAVQALAAFAHDPDVRALLVAAAGDQAPAVRQAAVRGLTALAADPDVRIVLISAAVDEVSPIRQEAVRALATLPAEPDIDALLLAHNRQSSTSEAVPRAVDAPVAAADLRDLLLDRAAGSEHAAVRRAAVEALAALPADPGIRAALLDSAVNDNDPAVRRVALGATDTLSGDTGLLDLLGHAAGDTDATVRWTAIQILSTWPAGPGVSALLQDAAGDADAAVRRLAIQALAAAPAVAGTRDLLVEHAASDDDRDARAAAIAGLAAFRADPDVRAILLGAFRDHSVRAAAFRVLAADPVLPEVRALISQVAKGDGISQVAKGDDGPLRERAIKALSTLPAEPGIHALLLDAATDTNGSVRRAAVEALSAHVSDPAVKAALRIAASDANVTVRRRAIQALSPLPAEPGIRALLLDAADDGHVGVRQLAIQTLAVDPADPDTRALLLNAANSNVADVARPAAQALGARTAGPATASCSSIAPSAPSTRASARPRSQPWRTCPPTRVLAAHSSMPPSAQP